MKNTNTQNTVSNSIENMSSPYQLETISVIELQEPPKSASRASLNAVESWNNQVATKGSPKSGISDEKRKRSPLMNSFLVFIGNVSVEPFLFLYALVTVMSLSPAVFHHLVAVKVCFTTLEYPESICDHLDDKSILLNATFDDEVKETAGIHIWYNILLMTLPSALVLLFVGSWTDTNGRKLPIVLACLGSWAAMITLILHVYFMTELNTYYIMLASAAFGILGGFFSAGLGALMYIIDITSVERRTVRIGYMEGSMVCGAFFGLFLGTVVQKRGSYISAFFLGALSNIVCILYVVCVLKDTVRSESPGFWKQLGHLLNPMRVKEAISSCFREREDHHRIHIIFLLFILMVYSFPVFAEMYAATEHIKPHFKWSDTTFGYYQMIVALFIIVGYFVALPILKRLGVSDGMIGIIGASTKFCSDLVSFLSPEMWAMLAASPTVIFSTLNIAVVHSMISKRIESNEQGKVMSIAVAIEVATPVIGLIVFSNLIDKTKEVFPGLFYIVSASLFFMCAVLMIIIWWDTRKQQSNVVVISTLSVSMEHEMTSMPGPRSKN